MASALGNLFRKIASAINGYDRIGQQRRRVGPKDGGQPSLETAVGFEYRPAERCCRTRQAFGGTDRSGEVRPAERHATRPPGRFHPVATDKGLSAGGNGPQLFEVFESKTSLLSQANDSIGRFKADARYPQNHFPIGGVDVYLKQLRVPTGKGLFGIDFQVQPGRCLADHLVHGKSIQPPKAGFGVAVADTRRCGMTQLSPAVASPAATGCTGRIVFGRSGQNGQLIFNAHMPNPVTSVAVFNQVSLLSGTSAP